MKRMLFVVFSVVPLSAYGLTGQAGNSGQAGNADTAFGWIKNLAGGWEGSYEWSGGAPRKGPMDAKYYVTGNGSAVVEDLLDEGKPVMTSVYHLDGSDLRMTHYCAAGNQPRLKATNLDDAHREIRFDMIDITNLKSPTTGHVAHVDLTCRDDNNLVLRFTFMAGEKERIETVTLRRAKG